MCKFDSTQPYYLTVETEGEDQSYFVLVRQRLHMAKILRMLTNVCNFAYNYHGEIKYTMHRYYWHKKQLVQNIGQARLPPPFLPTPLEMTCTCKFTGLPKQILIYHHAALKLSS